MTRTKTVGFLLAPRKYAKLPLADLSTHLTIITLTPDNWRQQLARPELRLDVLVHKLADFYVHDRFATDPFAGFAEVVAAACSAGRIGMVCDAMDGIAVLQNRLQMLREMDLMLPKSTRLAVPQWTDEGPQVSEDWFPVIAKPLDACGSSTSHLMQLLPFPSPTSLVDHVYQRFIPHAQVLYKVYVVGKSVDVVVRASISSDVFSKLSEFEYGVTVGKAQISGGSALARLRPFMASIGVLIASVKERLGLRLFGVDVIVGEDGATAYIIDVNYFPGYDGVPDLANKLISAWSLN